MKEGRVGSGRMKASGGCENLKTLADGKANLSTNAAALGWEDAEGEETSGEALLVGVR